MRVVVDFNRCQGNANCMDMAPDVFEVQLDGTLVILQEEPPEDQRFAVSEAVRMCPTRAVSVID